MNIKWKLLLAISCLLSVNVHARFVCHTVDKDNHYWRGTGEFQERACAVAMSFCTSHSPNGKSCQVFEVKEMNEQS